MVAENAEDAEKIRMILSCSLRRANIQNFGDYGYGSVRTLRTRSGFVLGGDATGTLDIIFHAQQWS